MSIEAKIEELRVLSDELAKQYAAQNAALGRYFEQLRRIGEIAGIPVEDVIAHRDGIEIIIARLRMRGIPELDAAATILEYSILRR